MEITYLFQGTYFGETPLFFYDQILEYLFTFQVLFFTHLSHFFQ